MRRRRDLSHRAGGTDEPQRGATIRLTAPAYWKFESSPLQRRVGCELGYCKGGPAASFRGRHKRVCDSNAAPHSDDVRTGSTAVDADGQSEEAVRSELVSETQFPC